MSTQDLPVPSALPPRVPALGSDLCFHTQPLCGVRDPISISQACIVGTLPGLVFRLLRGEQVAPSHFEGGRDAMSAGYQGAQVWAATRGTETLYCCQLLFSSLGLGHVTAVLRMSPSDAVLGTKCGRNVPCYFPLHGLCITLLFFFFFKYIYYFSCCCGEMPYGMEGLLWFTVQSR